MDGRRGIRLTIFTVLENVWNKTTELYEKFKEQPLRAVILILVILSLFAGATLFVFFVRHPEQTAQIVANQSMSNDIPSVMKVPAFAHNKFFKANLKPTEVNHLTGGDYILNVDA